MFPLLSWFPQFQEVLLSSPSIRPDNGLDELQSQSGFPSPAGEPVPDTAKSVPAALKSAVKSDFASKTSSVTKSVISCFL